MDNNIMDRSEFFSRWNGPGSKVQAHFDKYSDTLGSYDHFKDSDVRWYMQSFNPMIRRIRNKIESQPDMSMGELLQLHITSLDEVMRSVGFITMRTYYVQEMLLWVADYHTFDNMSLNLWFAASQAVGPYRHGVWIPQ